MKTTMDILRRHHLASSERICDDWLEGSEVGSPVRHNLFVDIVSFTTEGDPLYFEQIKRRSLLACAAFAQQYLSCSGYVAHIFLAEVSGNPDLDLWQYYESKYQLATDQRGPVIQIPLTPWVRYCGIGVLGAILLSQPKWR